ncbi:MAG: bifunctional riboflavin kinase/FAD synthetase [Xanthomonadaceae bacterium]|nr:bifunctional riboflavin kinase/FAD synthetase [Xanthomonadaceae bacterium]
MKLIRHLPAADQARPLAIAVGNFDGLHLGHQALIAETVAETVAETPDGTPGFKPAMLCFDPLPRTFFRPDQPVPRVMNLRDKCRFADRLGIELLVLLRFDHEFSSLSPEQFARDVLARDLNAGRVIVGRNFRFGHRAAGDLDDLTRYGRQFGFETCIVDLVSRPDGNAPPSDNRISSSLLRQVLARGDLATAERLLGRPYSISGRVIRGKQLGRELGFATANLRVAEPPALTGIAAVRVSGGGLVRHPGVASLGRRPTVAGRDWLLEVHLLDFDGDLYGRHIDVEFVRFIRHEEHFDSLESMTKRMHIDLALAKQHLQRSPC